MLELRIHGRGGQGVVTMADILSKAALAAGKEAHAMPFFGVERRGAAIRACVRIGDRPILLRSMSYQPDMVALMHENMLSYARQEGFTEGQDGAVLIVNGKTPVEAKGVQWLVDAEQIARTHDLVLAGDVYINVPMSGAISKVMGIPLEAVETAVREIWPGDRATPNLAAVRDAYEQTAIVKGGSEA